MGGRLRPGRAILALLVASVSFSGTLRIARAYSPGLHESAVRGAVAALHDERGLSLEGELVEAIVEGVREPDKVSLGTLQMAKQRVEAGSWGAQRPVSLVRIAAQSYHGSPNPLRVPYTSSAEDQALQAAGVARPPGELSADRVGLDLYAYDTNQDVRNRILINASQLLCVSFTQRDEESSARRFGNMLHMVADTYSASHVQRSEPTGSPGRCGTERILWHYSMDVVAWKQHTPADGVDDDWRFRCLGEHTADLTELWVKGRAKVRSQADEEAAREEANEQVGASLRLLCEEVLREDPQTLALPAGGAAAGYSSASGKDNWRLFKKADMDRPIQPVGLTGEAESVAFQEEVRAGLARRGGPASFWYPPRSLGDLCAQLTQTSALPAALQCTAQEVGWARSGDSRVDTMWIPPREGSW